MTYHKANPLKGYAFKDEVGPLSMPDCGGAEGVTEIPPEQETYLRDLIEFLQAEGKDALFIVSPYGESLTDQKMYNYMEEIVLSYGYPFLNMNNYYEEIGLVFEEDFADYGSHTNVVGTEKCTDFLRDYLRNHYDFADKRGDSAYSSWDESYRLWQREAESAREKIRERIANEDYAVVGEDE